MLVRGMSFAFALIPLQAATFSNIAPQDSGRASSLFNTNRQVASSLGVAILATVLSDRSQTRVDDAIARGGDVQHALVRGFHDGFIAAAILAAIALAATFLIHDEDAAASMRPASGTAAPTSTEEREPVGVH